MMLKLNRQGDGKGKLTIEGELVVKSKTNASFNNFTINEAIPQVISVDYSGRQDSAGYYFWQGQVKCEFTIDEGSGDYFTLLPAASAEYVNFKMDKISAVFDACSLGIESFRISPSSTFTPSSGGSINFSSTINDTSDQAIYWTLSVLDQTFNGSGNSVNATWDGKKGDGTVVLPGSYSATLTATTADGQCSDSKTINFAVIPPPDGQCGLYVQFGSSAHMPSGNLNHSQNLFSTQGGSLPLGLTLYYNSLDPHDGTLGRGWSHNYDISLKENPDGSVLISKGDMKYDYFTLTNGAYAPQAGNYATLAKNGDGTFTLTEKDGQALAFSDDGKLVTTIDRNGNTLTFTYGSDDLTAVTDPFGRTANFTYDSAHHLVSVTDQAGNVYSFTVGATLSGITLPDSATWQYTYDDNAYMLTKTDPVGTVTSYAYDDRQRVISSVDSEGRTRDIAYPLTTDAVRSSTFTEKDGGVWMYTYDTLKGTLSSKTDPQGGVTNYTYDVAGNRTSTAYPDSSTTTATYDARGNMLTSTDALNQTTRYTYNNFGQVTGITDPLGGVTTYTYDDKGNMIALADPGGATTKYEYDAKGNIIKITDSSGVITGYTYDLNGNLVAVTDNGGAITRYDYDNAGNVASIADPEGAVTRFVYNARNSLIKTIDPNGNSWMISYDANGNKLSGTDANGNVTKYEYNSQNQLIKIVDTMGNVTIYAYGGSACPSCGGSTDKLTSVTDANSNVTRYTYDQLGRLVTETDPLGNATSYSYDLKGNLTAKTDANGNTISLSYDANDRLLKKTYPDGSEETYTYDARGNVLSAANKDISYVFSYDAAGRMQSSADSNGKALQYSYDTAGRKTKTIYPEGSVVSYVYDDTGRLASITNGGGRQYSYSYDKLGRRTKLTYPNGTTASYTYDAKSNLTSLIHKTSTGKVINSFSYTHDKVGNRLTKAEPDITFNYGYDPVYRLLSALPTKPHGRGGLQGHKAENYSYDPVGNRLTGPHDQETYAYGPGNELLTTRYLQFGYDKNGNRIEKARLHQEGHNKGEQHDHDGNRYGNGKWSYSFDFENRLIKAEKKHGHEATIVTFKYDPFGRRIEKRIREGENCRSNDEVIHTYVYDGQAIILETETTGDGRNRITEPTKYVHGPNIDQPLAMERDGKIYYYHADGVGSVFALSDSAGRVIQTYEYDSFGNMQSQKNRIEQPFTYTAREWDKETRLYYYRARYYDPMEGRFIQKDPIGFNGGINVYVYTSNNPINRTDPSGLTDRYSWCGKKPGCKKLTDWACNYSEGAKKYCCKADLDCCMSDIDPQDPGLEGKIKDCYNEFSSCVQNIKPSKDREPLKPPPGTDRYPSPPGRGNPNTNYPNW